MQSEYLGVVFFDLDGTLLNEKSQVSPDVGLAIRQLRQNGYLPVISTGRSPLEIVAAQAATGIDTFISLNGCYLEHRHKAVYRGAISRQTVHDVVQTVTELGDAVSFYTTDQIMTTRVTPLVKAAYESIHTPIPKPDPTFYQHHEILMLLLLTQENDEIYAKRFPNLTYYRNGPYSIDTIQRGNSKMNGITKMIERLQLQGLPTYGFGDGPNDLTMLHYVDHPVAMGNGIDKVKAAAEFVTGSNREDGIIRGLKHYNLI